MTPIKGIISSFILLLIRSTLCCDRVSEFESRNVTTTNTSHLIGYQLVTPCPPLYHLSGVLLASLSKPASPQSDPLTITDLLTAACLRRNATPCTIDIPLRGLDVPDDSTTLNVKVKYTCQLGDPGSIPSLATTWRREVTETARVKYIRVILSSARMDWNCSFSSSSGGSASWSWVLEEESVASAFQCTSWNRTLVQLPRRIDASLLCMERQSSGTIWVKANMFSTTPAYSIAFDIQVPLASDFDIVCDAETPPNTNVNIEHLNDSRLDSVKSYCNQLTWSKVLPSTPLTLSTSTSRTLASNSEIPVGTEGDSAEQKLHTKLRVTALGLGLGIGLGLLVLISAVALAVICIRRKNRCYDAKSRILSNGKAEVGGATGEKDGGFVLATDVFAVQNIYSEVSEVNLQQNPFKPIQEINTGNGVEGYYTNSQNVPTEETAENRYDQESTPPAVTCAPSGDRKPKRASSLSRRLFMQIAALAKQEERQSQIPNGEGSRERPGGAVEVGGSQTSIVDRWLYSSTLNSAENTLNQNDNHNGAVYISRRFEIDI